MSFTCQDRLSESVAQARGTQFRRARRRFFPGFSLGQGAVAGVLLALLLAPAAVAEDGFVSLMPKKDITEFWTYDVAPASSWSIKDGMIYCTGKPNGFLRSKKVYKNFIFRGDWRFVKEGWTGKPPDWPNAGFFINAQEVINGWPRSLEVQGHFGEAASVFGVRGGKVTGAKRGEIVKDRIPFGDWDHVEVHSQDGHVVVFLNGKKVNEGSDISPAEGNVCLESEGWPLWYRNIEIKDLGK